jgi:hypothetical protein
MVCFCFDIAESSTGLPLPRCDEAERQREYGGLNAGLVVKGESGCGSMAFRDTEQMFGVDRSASILMACFTNPTLTAIQTEYKTFCLAHL